MHLLPVTHLCYLRQLVSSDSMAVHQLAVTFPPPLHRQLVSSDSVTVHQLAVTIVGQIVSAAASAMSHHRQQQHQCSGHPANHPCEGCEADLAGEGGETGEINTPNSLVFAALQVSTVY